MNDYDDDWDTPYAVKPFKHSQADSIPDPCIIIKIDGTYDARSFKDRLRVNGPTREEAMRRLHSLQTGAYE